MVSNNRFADRSIFSSFLLFCSLLLCVQAYENQQTIRVDESLAALAFCARQDQHEKLRQLANEAALAMLSTQNDFFLYVKYCTDISLKLRGGTHKGWGNGMRKFVKKWYERWTPTELANMYGEHRGAHKWKHRDVWHLGHLKCDDAPVAEAAAAADDGGDAAPAPPALPSERTMVNRFIFHDGQSYLAYLDTLPTNDALPDAVRRMRELQYFKTNENIENAIEQIRQYGFTLLQTPAHLLHNANIWEALLPSLSYNDLLDSLFQIKDANLLVETSSFYLQYLSALSKFNDCTVAKPPICPIRVFSLKRRYEKNVRYLPKHKADKYAKRMLKRRIKPVEGVTQQLSAVLEHTLNTAQPIPAKFHVTIDLRKANLRSKISIIILLFIQIFPFDTAFLKNIYQYLTFHVTLTEH